MYGNTFQNPSRFGSVVTYNSYKLLTVFRARTLPVRGIVGRPAGRGRRRPRAAGRGRNANRPRRRERNLVDEKIVKRRMPRELMDEPEKTKAIEPIVKENSAEPAKEVKSKMNEVENRKLRWRRGRRVFRRSFWRGRRRGRGRRNHHSPVHRPVYRPVQQQFRGGPVPAPPSQPTILRSVRNGRVIPRPVVVPPRRRNFNRSFSNLLNRNDESRAVFMRRIPEPVNILPLIPWRPIEQRREILSSGNPARPFWPFRVIRRIWRGRNPQIAPYRDVPLLRDGIISVRL
jgi:hypothetical protein